MQELLLQLQQQLFPPAFNILGLTMYLVKGCEALAQVPRAVVGSLSMEVFEKRVDVALKTHFSGEHCGGVGLMIGFMI